MKKTLTKKTTKVQHVRLIGGPHDGVLVPDVGPDVLAIGFSGFGVDSYQSPKHHYILHEEQSDITLFHHDPDDCEPCSASTAWGV